jgi:uracil-DNA glycosylase family 4
VSTFIDIPDSEITDISKRKHPLAICEECPLYDSDFVPTVGDANAKYAVVSRSPGYNEAKHGEPFSGPSGKVLNHLLAQNGVKREEALLTNVVLCATQAPSTEAIKCCAPRLHSELEAADTIIAAGSEAAKAIGKLSSLSGNRGYAHTRYNSMGKRQRMVVTNNPAIVLKDDSTFPNLVRDFKLAINPLPPATLPKVEWTNEVQQGQEFLYRLRRRILSPGFMEEGIPLSVDIETKGLDHTRAIVSIGFSIGGNSAFAIGEQVCSDPNTMQNYVRPILEHRACDHLWHNGKFDVRNIRHKGIAAKVDQDTLLLSYACDERSDEKQVHSLDYLVMNELNWPYYEPEEVSRWKAAVSRYERNHDYGRLERLETPDELYYYNALDAAGTAQLYPILRERAINDSVFDYYSSYLLPDSNALITVELEGLNYDVHRAADINENEVLPELDRLREEMRLIVGDGSYNPNSAQQNAALVYDKWKIIHEIDRGEDKERSVDKAVYTEIKEGRFVIGGLFTKGEMGTLHTIVSYKAQLKETAIRWAERFARFKELDKQRSTYIESLIARAEHAEGKIYSDFKLHSTVTGRSSSSRPNLQNITRAKEGLPNIRSLFTPSEGCTILSADYSQAELRTIAKLSGDRNLGEIYRTGVSLHKQVAERFYGKDYTYEEYVHAKNMDFGVAYGQSADTFQEKHDVPIEEGQEFIKWWFNEFPGVKKWRASVAREVKLKRESDFNYVQTPFGHKRRFYLITYENKGAVFREAINCIPQNIAARFTLWAVRRLVDLNLPVINTVHDSIILDVPNTRLEEVAVKVREVMQSAPMLTIGWDFPFEAELQVGKSWGELEDYTL